MGVGREKTLEREEKLVSQEEENGYWEIKSIDIDYPRQRRSCNQAAQQPDQRPGGNKGDGDRMSDTSLLGV